ncbi:MAG: general stress protein CsbD [Deltaproteobacteria bacterium RIFOXYC2_FULL_48_10]|nr:MAG: general stress protein CsbD [Deltaproteobacteria bacterium RIFOXYC2_FULL_48_10]OGR00093.1 MAG: general stress protein CsbD [Deltaproteobacteria bacterium RIFOXYA12_FULL_61_11]
MNKDQAKGTWEQIKGRAKKAWGELTDDDLKKAEGSVDKLYGVIQEKFGDTKEAILAKLDKLHL